MGFDSSKGGSNTAGVTVQQLHVQNAQYNVPIPILYGQVRVAANVIWAGNFVQIYNKHSGGKGAGNTTTTFSYTCAAIFSMCIGPVTQILAHWNDGAYHGYRTYAQMVAGGWQFFLGNPGQGIWPFLTNKYPEYALPYSNIAYACNSDIQLGATPNLPQYNWEVAGILQYGGSSNIVDALPSAIINDLMTNTLYGLGLTAATGYAGYQSTAFDEYCIASNTFISPVLDQQDTISDWFAQFVEICHGGVVWSEGYLKFQPYYDETITGNGTTFTPNLTPVYNLGWDDFVRENKDDSPITVSRKNPQDRYNVVDVEYENRGANYKTQVAEAKSQADIQQYSLRREPSRIYHPIKTPGLANWVAQLKLLWNITARNTYKYKLQQRYLLLDPLDIVSVTDEELGLDEYPVRITSITEDAETGILDIEAEDLGTNNNPGYPRQVVSSTILVNNNVTPSSVNVPAFIEPTSEMVGGIPYIWIALSGQNANLNWGGCHVYYSEDSGATYNLLGEVTIAAAQGILYGPLNGYSGSNPDTVDTLQVDLSQSGGELFSISQALAANGNNLCWIGDYNGQFEFLTFDQQVAGGSTDQYQMGAAAGGNLYRNLFGSNPNAIPWTANFQFVYCGVVGNLDSGLFQWEYPTRLIGQSVLFKFTSFNASNTNEENAFSVVAYNYTIIGTSYSGGTNSSGSSPEAFGANPAWQANTDYLENSVVLDSNGNGELLITATNVDWNYTSSKANHPGFATVDFLTTNGVGVPVYTTALSVSQDWCVQAYLVRPSGSTPPLNLGVGSGSDAISANCEINCPNGVQAGDLLIAEIVGESSGWVITPPSGWTLFDNAIGPGSNLIAWTYYKFAGASEPSSYTFVGSSSLANNGNILAFRGAGAPNTGYAFLGNSNAPYTPNITADIIGQTNALCVISFAWSSTAVMTLGGESGPSTPSWSGSLGGTTTDGMLTWENVGAITPYSQWATIASTSINMANKKDKFLVSLDLTYAYTNRQNNDQVQWELIVNGNTVAAKGKIALQSGTEAAVQDLRAIFSRSLSGYNGTVMVAVAVRTVNGSGNSTFQFVSINPVLTASPQVPRSISGESST